MDIYSIKTALSCGRTIYDLPLRVAYYARVSTDKDEQLHSLSSQIRYYTEFIQSCPNWTFAEGYIDEGLSGTSVVKRENFLRMIADARENRFDFIVTKEISRFSRSTLDSIRYTQELLRCGVGVLFQSDNINTLMPDAELRLTIMSSIAQDEVRKTSERVRFGLKRAIENGVVLGNNHIWGYEKREGKLVIREEEAEIVRTIFDLYANKQMGIRMIARHLNAQGFRNTRGNAFSFSTIRGILSNPKYKGYYCGGKSCKYDYKINDRKYFSREEWVVYKDEEKVPSVVSEELWDKANRILARRSAAQSTADRTSYQNKYPYSGKIICGIHKQSYYRSLYRYKSGNKEVWQCQEYSKKGRCGCCAPILYTSEMDEIVRQLLEQRFVRKNDIIQELVRLYTSIRSQSRRNEDIARIRGNMEEVLRRKDKLLDLNIDGRITNEEFTLRNERFNWEIEKHTARLRELEEALKNRDRVPFVESLQQAIMEELTCKNGFSAGVIDALLDHIEVEDAGDKNQVHVHVFLKESAQSYDYLVKRRRGNPSVCSRQYI